MYMVLQRRGAKKNVQNLRDVTPLLAATFFGHAPVVEVLLQRCGCRAAVGWAFHVLGDRVSVQGILSAASCHRRHRCLQALLVHDVVSSYSWHI